MPGKDGKTRSGQPYLSPYDSSLSFVNAAANGSGACPSTRADAGTKKDGSGDETSKRRRVVDEDKDQEDANASVDSIDYRAFLAKSLHKAETSIFDGSFTSVWA